VTSPSADRIQIADMLRVGGNIDRPDPTLTALDITTVLHYEPYAGQTPPQTITVRTVTGTVLQWEFAISAYLTPDLGAELVVERAEDIADAIEALLSVRVGEFTWRFGWHPDVHLYVAELTCVVGREDF